MEPEGYSLELVHYNLELVGCSSGLEKLQEDCNWAQR